MTNNLTERDKRKLIEKNYRERKKATQEEQAAYIRELEEELERLNALVDELLAEQAVQPL